MRGNGADDPALQSPRITETPNYIGAIHVTLEPFTMLGSSTGDSTRGYFVIGILACHLVTL